MELKLKTDMPHSDGEFDLTARITSAGETLATRTFRLCLDGTLNAVEEWIDEFVASTIADRELRTVVSRGLKFTLGTYMRDALPHISTRVKERRALTDTAGLAFRG